MLHISLEDVQKALPMRRVSALFWKYYPSFEGYQIKVWMDVPLDGESRCRFDKTIPEALAPSKEHVLRLLVESIEREFETRATKGLSKA